jgi:hypothetical protein
MQNATSQQIHPNNNANALAPHPNGALHLPPVQPWPDP